MVYIVNVELQQLNPIASIPLCPAHRNGGEYLLSHNRFRGVLGHLCEVGGRGQ